VLRDVVNGLEGHGLADVDKENLGVVDGSLEMDMDADFDPTDFGVY